MTTWNSGLGGRAPTRRGDLRGRCVCIHQTLAGYALLPKKLTLQKLARSYTRPKLFTSAPTDYGKRYEGKALEDYSQKTSTTIKQSGFHISCAIPYLGCSPDGLVGTDGVVEVKCPYSARYMEVTPVTVPYLNMIDGKLQLRGTIHITTTFRVPCFALADSGVILSCGQERMLSVLVLLGMKLSSVRLLYKLLYKK